MKKNGRIARQREKHSIQSIVEAEESKKPRSKWLRRGVIVASCILIIMISLVVWNGTNSPPDLVVWNGTNSPPDSGQQPKHAIEASKAVILDGLYSESPNLTVSQSLTNYLSAAGYKVDDFRGNNVTIDLLTNIANYSVVILRLHSGLDKYGNLYITSGEPYTESKYAMEQLRGSVGKAETSEGKLYFALKLAFLGAGEQGSLENSTVILMGCNGTGDPVGIVKLWERGVKTYIAWTGYVDLSHSDSATLTLVENLYIEKLGPAAAVEKTMAETHPDPFYQTVYQCFVR